MATLRQLRKQQDLTQEQLAVAADVSSSTIYHIEAGKVRPRPSIVRRLAHALAVAPDEIDVGSPLPRLARETAHGETGQHLEKARTR